MPRFPTVDTPENKAIYSGIFSWDTCCEYTHCDPARFEKILEYKSYIRKLKGLANKGQAADRISDAAFDSRIKSCRGGYFYPAEIEHFYPASDIGVRQLKSMYNTLSEDHALIFVIFQGMPNEVPLS
jgi:hypothetical protein